MLLRLANKQACSTSDLGLSFFYLLLLLPPLVSTSTGSSLIYFSFTSLCYVSGFDLDLLCNVRVCVCARVHECVYVAAGDNIMVKIVNRSLLHHQ